VGALVAVRVEVRLQELEWEISGQAPVDGAEEPEREAAEVAQVAQVVMESPPRPPSQTPGRPGG
jgi:hypothetical protein